MLTLIKVGDNPPLESIFEVCCKDCGGSVKGDIASLGKRVCRRCGKAIIYPVVQNLVDRLLPHQIEDAMTVYNRLGYSYFMDIVDGVCDEGCYLKPADHHFYGQYKFSKNLRWVKKGIASDRIDLEFFALAKAEQAIEWKMMVTMVSKYFDPENIKTPITVDKLYKRGNTEKEIDKDQGIKEKVILLCTMLLDEYQVIDAAVEEGDISDEIIEKLNKFTEIGMDIEIIDRLKNGGSINLSLLEFVMKYREITTNQPIVTQKLNPYKLTVINDLPSKHPFYDWLHDG